MLPTLSIPSLALALVLADASNLSAPYITVAAYVSLHSAFLLTYVALCHTLPYVVWYFVTCNDV